MTADVDQLGGWVRVKENVLEERFDHLENYAAEMKSQSICPLILQHHSVQWNFGQNYIDTVQACFSNNTCTLSIYVH